MDSRETLQKIIAIDSKLASDEELPSSTGAYTVPTSQNDNAAPDEEKPGWRSSSTDGRWEAVAGPYEHQEPITSEGSTYAPVPSSLGVIPSGNDTRTYSSDRHQVADYHSIAPPGNMPDIWSSRPYTTYNTQNRWPDAELERVLEMSRNETDVASNALSIIDCIMMNQNVDAIAATNTLEDLRLQCLQADVSFAELLGKHVEGYGMPPLTVETSRCDFEGSSDLLLFLAQHTASNKKMEYIRQGCMWRKDNLFERLQSMLGASKYVVSSEQYATPYTSAIPDKRPHNTFRALISIPDFATDLEGSAIVLDIRQEQASTISPGSMEPGLASDAGVVIELVALGRYWKLLIGRNRLVLSLMDGQECSVDATLTIIEEQLGDLAPAVLYNLENPGAPIPEMLSPSMPQPGSSMETTAGRSTFDKTSSSFVDLTTWTTSASLDKRASLPEICEEVAHQHPHSKDNITLKSATKSRLRHKPYFRFSRDQKAKVQGGTYDHLQDTKDMDMEDAAHKAEHPGQEPDEDVELIAVVDEAGASKTTGGPSPKKKWTVPPNLPILPAPNPSGNPNPPVSAATIGPLGSFFFPPTTLYPQETWKGTQAHYVEIPRCFPSNSKRPSFVDLTLQSGQLVVQLVMRLYDEQDDPGTSSPSIHTKISSSVGATGPPSSFVGSSMAYRSKAGSSSSGDWSVIHDDDIFDTDGTEKGSAGDSTDSYGSCGSDLG
ncbi:hypothetical protein FRB95_011592 [Tulasnella sp. JGI-2019a]|nr:hypothetical protein FRB95_011592 [Tulasnella sp. JGI-2019a]